MSVATTPIGQIQQAIDLIRSTRRTLICPAEHEQAVRDAVARCDAPGLFTVQVSEFLPAGTVLMFKTELLDPPPGGYQPEWRP